MYLRLFGAGNVNNLQLPAILAVNHGIIAGETLQDTGPAAGGVGAAGKETERDAAGEASPPCRKSLFQTPLSLCSSSHLVFTNLFKDFINGVPERQSWSAMAMFL